MLGAGIYFRSLEPWNLKNTQHISCLHTSVWPNLELFGWFNCSCSFSCWSIFSVLILSWDL